MGKIMTKTYLNSILGARSLSIRSLLSSLTVSPSYSTLPIKIPSTPEIFSDLRVSYSFSGFLDVLRFEF